MKTEMEKEWEKEEEWEIEKEKRQIRRHVSTKPRFVQVQSMCR